SRPPVSCDDRDHEAQGSGVCVCPCPYSRRRVPAAWRKIVAGRNACTHRSSSTVPPWESACGFYLSEPKSARDAVTERDRLSSTANRCRLENDPGLCIKAR